LDVKPLTGFWQDQWECLFGQLRAFIDCGNLTMAAFLDALYAKNVRRPGHAGYRHQSRARAKRTNVGRNDMNTVARESDKELNEAAIAALVAELEPAAKPVEASVVWHPVAERFVGTWFSGRSVSEDDNNQEASHCRTRAT